MTQVSSDAGEEDTVTFFKMVMEMIKGRLCLGDRQTKYINLTRSKLYLIIYLLMGNQASSFCYSFNITEFSHYFKQMK